MSGTSSPSTTAVGLGVTAMLTSGEEVTVTDAEPTMPERRALTEAEPTARAVAWPCCPAAFETPTIVVALDDQVADSVTSAVELSA